MKKGKGLTLKINLSNRWLYTFIFIGILAIIAVGVYAYGTNNPSSFGHSSGEISFNTKSIPASAINFSMESQASSTCSAETEGLVIYNMTQTGYDYLKGYHYVGKLLVCTKDNWTQGATTYYWGSLN